MHFRRIFANVRSILLFGLLMIFSAPLNAQVIGTHSKLEVGVGYVFSHHDGFGILRTTIALNDLIANERNKIGIGIYVTPEYRGTTVFIEDGLNYYFRIPMGATIKITPSVGLFGGVDWYHLARGKNPRSEAGLVWIMDERLTLRMGYSQWVGATVGFGYQWTLVETPFRE